MTSDPRTMAPFTTPDPPTTAQEPFANGQAEPDTGTGKNRDWRIWLLRVRALLFVTLCATFGVLLLILPWTPKWTDNPLLLTSPALRHVVSSGFVRGLSSGLGMLDLWLGFWEAIHYHESSG